MSPGGKKRPSSASGRADQGAGADPSPIPTAASGASSGAPTWPDRVQMALDSGRLRIQPTSHAAVVAVWRKSVESARARPCQG